MSAPIERGLGREIVLTLNGPDRRGIVHAVSGAMLGLDLTILDSQQFGDPSTGEFHLRMHLGGDAAIDPVAGNGPSVLGPVTSGFVAMNRAPPSMRRIARVIAVNEYVRVSPSTT